MLPNWSIFFNFYRSPIHFQTDNGRESKNEIVDNLCQKKKIKRCYGKPYYPQSQGVIEKLNDLISKPIHASLTRFKRPKNTKQTDLWDLEGALKSWALLSNKNVHSVTKQIPLVVITITNPQEIKKIQENIRSYNSKKQETSICKEPNFNIGTKVFIIREMKKVKSKNKLLPENQNALKKPRKKKGSNCC